MPEVNGDYARIIVRQTLTGWPDLVNVLAVRVIDAESPLATADAQQIITRVENFYLSFADRLSTAWGIDNITVTDFNTPTTPTMQQNSNVVGTLAGDLLPADTAVCMTLRTGLRGKHFRGRTYLGGFTEAACTAAGEIDTVTRDDIIAGAAVLIANLQGDGFPLAVVSTQLNNEARAAAVVTPVTTVDINNIFDRQRRRSRR